MADLEFEFAAAVDLLPLLFVVSRFLSSDDIVEMVVENVDLGHLEGNDAGGIFARGRALGHGWVADRWGLSSVGL